MIMLFRLLASFVALLVMQGTQMTAATSDSEDSASQPAPMPEGKLGKEAFASRSYFYAGGTYINATLPPSNVSRKYCVGQIYVERLVPCAVSQEVPLVFVAGNAQTGTNWLNTPDGREGWASYFLRKGYVVYLTDSAQRGRSPWLPGAGEISAFSVEQIEQQFTGPEHWPSNYPQAHLHTQWPGSGLHGDPVFDDFYAGQVQIQTNTTMVAQYNNASYAALLDRTGPAIVITHSQAGAFGWQLGDCRSDLVKAIIALEPVGPPFEDYVGPPFASGFARSGNRRPFGLTELPLKYDPPIGDDASLLAMRNISGPSANLSSCSLQADPPRRLANLANVPVLLLTSQASYHAVYDHCTAAYLNQAGVTVKHVYLADVGIFGNGHFMFLEKNNLEIARLVESWIADTICHQETLSTSRV